MYNFPQQHDHYNFLKYKTFKNHSDKQEIVDQINDNRIISLPPKDSVFYIIFISVVLWSFFQFFFLCARYSFSSCISCLPFFYFFGFSYKISECDGIHLSSNTSSHIKHYYYYVHIQDSLADKISLWYIKIMGWNLLLT